MRRLIFLSILFCSVFLSCGNDEEEAEFYFRGSLDGVEFSTSQSAANGVPDIEQDYIISGTRFDDDGLLISINFSGIPDEGNYTFEDDGVIFIIAEGSDLWGTVLSSVGTVEITENTDAYIMGTCSFEAEHVTNGSIRCFTNGSFKAQKF